MVCAVLLAPGAFNTLNKPRRENLKFDLRGLEGFCHFPMLYPEEPLLRLIA